MMTTPSPKVKKYLDDLRKLPDDKLVEALESLMEYGASNWDGYLSVTRNMEDYIGD